VIALSFSKIVKKESGATENILTSEAIVGGLDPEARHLSPGPLPKGAFIQQHQGGGYCPPRNQESGILLAIYALPQGQRVDRSESVGLGTIENLHEISLAWGSMSAIYGAGS